MAMQHAACLSMHFSVDLNHLQPEMPMAEESITCSRGQAGHRIIMTTQVALHRQAGL